MQNWIHVDTATKIPLKRVGQPSAIEQFEDGENPNDSSSFGDDQPTMFLLVVKDYTEPVYDPVAESLARFETVGSDAITYEGHHVAPDWRQEWEVVARTLEDAKQYQLGQLANDYQTRLDAGYVDDGPGGSNKTFELSEINFGTLAHKHGWYTHAQSTGTIPGGRKASVFATDSTRVQFQNFNSFGDFFAEFGLVFDDVNEHYYVKADDIDVANSIGQLSAVTWDFNAL